MKCLQIVYDELNNNYFVKYNWVNFYTKNQHIPYKLVYEGTSKEDALKAYKEEMKKWL